MFCLIMVYNCAESICVFFAVCVFGSCVGSILYNFLPSSSSPWIFAWKKKNLDVKFGLYLVVHGFFLADQLGSQDQHLLFADLQFLTGGVQLVQEHLVSRRTRRPGTCGCITQQAFPHLCQVMLQLLVFRLQLLTLQDDKVQHHGKTLPPRPSAEDSFTFRDSYSSSAPRAFLNSASSWSRIKNTLMRTPLLNTVKCLKLSKMFLIMFHISIRKMRGKFRYPGSGPLELIFFVFQLIAQRLLFLLQLCNAFLKFEGQRRVHSSGDILCDEEMEEKK